MKSHRFAMLLMIAANFACAATSQADATERVRGMPEVTTKVLDARGKVVAPWTETRKCIVATNVCEMTLFNSETGEIAKFGDKWVDGYKKTERGLEVSLTAPPASRGKSSKDPILEE